MSDKQKEQKPAYGENKKNNPEENIAPGSHESYAMKNKRDKEKYQQDLEEPDKDHEEHDPAIEKRKS
jgi:hypothetical protein